MRYPKTRVNLRERIVGILVFGPENCKDMSYADYCAESIVKLVQNFYRRKARGGKK